jgi:uncharacterized protein with ParB-like and HNH nuclease domain
MSYNTTTIEATIAQINKGLYLPAIQRPYVWDPDQIVALFDSLMKGYPISSFLFWDINKENRSKWEVYRFVERFKHGNVHNEKSRTDGQNVILVLDGQQRLTSLLIGLHGSYIVKAKNKRKDNPDAWTEQLFYLDLLKAPEEPDEEHDLEIGVTYGFKFSDSIPRNGTDHYWFKVGDILDYAHPNTLDALVDKIDSQLPTAASRAERRTVEKNLKRLHQIIWSENSIAVYTEKDQAYDRVLDIFIRANDGGTRLSKSDLLMSLVTLSWQGVNGRDEIFALVDRLNDQLSRKNEISRDFILKAALVLSDLDVKYLAKNFTTANLFIIQDKWPSIKKSIEWSLRLVNSFGLDAETLTSLNALIPIIYFVHKVARPLDGTTVYEAKNRTLIQRFLLGALINGTFSGTSDAAIALARGVLKDHLREDEDFPGRKLAAELTRRGRIATFSKESIGHFLDITYGRREAFLALSLLYDRNDWGSSSFHIDHIIPKSLADRKTLMGLNVPETRITKILEAVNKIGNLQLLLGRENLEKNAKQFDNWIETRDDKFLDQHFIPTERGLWSVEMLPEFVAAREKLMAKRLLNTHFEAYTPLQEITT